MRHDIACCCRPASGPDGVPGFWEPCAPSAGGAQERDLAWFASNDQADKVLVPPITRSDFEASMYRARPTVSPDDLAAYEKFTAEFGEEGV
jgi:vacuolar protein-sorting-associated protein 4